MLLGNGQLKFELKTVTDTENLGATLWKMLPRQCLVFLNGELGAGKTTLVRGVLREAGFSDAVKSPTFTLVEEYTIAGRKVFHFDLYRLTSPEELETIGIRDYLAQPSLCFIEWPELGRGFLPNADCIINLTIKQQSRLAEVLCDLKT